MFFLEAIKKFFAGLFAAFFALFTGGGGGGEVTTTKPYTPEPTVSVQIRYNDGVFEIPDKNFSVDIYKSFSQATTDRTNSANYGQQGQAYVVCDHYYQGFDVIKSVDIGTRCTVTLYDGDTHTYECAEIHPHCEKRNNVNQSGVTYTGIYMENGNGQNVFYLSEDRIGPWYLVTYTCNVIQTMPNGTDVYVVLWRQVS